jgi:AraC family transcriptional regulator, regulatory protein of adaptative response / methylated-DNA-[protein]-cysteine methyltransferase
MSNAGYFCQMKSATLKTLSFDDKYQAVLAKDSSYDGVFYTAVTSTGIFCHPSCTAKKPKRENVRFYDSAEEAVKHGFRPCKVCSPLERPAKTPGCVAALLEELGADSTLRLSDQDLRRRGVQPSFVRRWFKKNHGMSFQAYQRRLRINHAFASIAKGTMVTHAAFDAGFDSLSGFAERFKDIFGTSPARSQNMGVINLTRLDTPLGPMVAGATTEGVCLLEFTSRRMLERELEDLQRLLNSVVLPGTNDHLDQLDCELQEYFRGERQRFRVSLDSPGSPFQQEVWRSLQLIPYGETSTYKSQAIALNKPNAVRAMASANGQNRISIVIPCHRVIGNDGSLTGYGGGLPRKQWLLDFEREHR